SPPGGGMPLPGAISPAETGEIRARGEARRSEVDQSVLQGLVRFGDVNVANKLCATSRCSKAIIPIPDVESGKPDGFGDVRLARERREKRWLGERQRGVSDDRRMD